MCPVPVCGAGRHAADNRVGVSKPDFLRPSRRAAAADAGANTLIHSLLVQEIFPSKVLLVQPNKRFLFDLNGYLVVPNALTSAEVSGLNSIVGLQLQHGFSIWTAAAGWP